MDPPPERPPPELTEDLVESALLRVPPDDPRTLLRAALVCKAWCRLVSGAGFRRRFCELHRSPPILGFVYIRGVGTRPHFTPTACFRGHCADCRIGPDWYPVDARHGRFLFYKTFTSPPFHKYIVWDPITGVQRRLPLLPILQTCSNWNAALFCAATGCNHLDCCPRGPFRVALVCTDRPCCLTSTWIYSLEAGTWSNTASIEHPRSCLMRWRSICCTLVANSLYFIMVMPAESGAGYQILEYNVVNQDLSMISNLPPEWKLSCPNLIIGEDGGLGLAYVRYYKIHMWSREAVPNGWEWVPHRSIELGSLRPSDASLTATILISSANGIDIVIRSDQIGVFSIHLKSGLITKIGEINDFFSCIVPYLRFYTPRIILAEASTGDERVSTLQV